MKALHDLVESGKVRYIGACSMRCWKFSHLNKVASKNGWTKFVSMQDEYTLLYHEEVRVTLHGPSFVLSFGHFADLKLAGRQNVVLR